jgi:hypothetical protein
MLREVALALGKGIHIGPRREHHDAKRAIALQRKAWIDWQLLRDPSTAACRQPGVRAQVVGERHLHAANKL